MKALNWIAWISTGTGVILILLGLISLIVGHPILKADHTVNFFLIADTFFLLTIMLFIFLYGAEYKK